jgi:hypothetical protein
VTAFKDFAHLYVHYFFEYTYLPDWRAHGDASRMEERVLQSVNIVAGNRAASLASNPVKFSTGRAPIVFRLLRQGERPNSTWGPGRRAERKGHLLGMFDAYTTMEPLAAENWFGCLYPAGRAILLADVPALLWSALVQPLYGLERAVSRGSISYPPIHLADWPSSCGARETRASCIARRAKKARLTTSQNPSTSLASDLAVLPIGHYRS